MPVAPVTAPAAPAAAKPIPFAQPGAPAAATAPAPAPAAPAAVPGAPAASTAAPATAPATEAAPADPHSPAAAPADARDGVDTLLTMSAADAIKQVDANLELVAGLRAGGDTTKGTDDAKRAGALLIESSLLLQRAHIDARDTIKGMDDQLQTQVMGVASGLAFLGGQISVVTRATRSPIDLSALCAKPFEQARQVTSAMAKLLASAHPSETPAADAAAPPAAAGSTATPAPAHAPAPAPGPKPQPAPAPAPGPRPMQTPAPGGAAPAPVAQPTPKYV